MEVLAGVRMVRRVWVGVLAVALAASAAAAGKVAVTASSVHEGNYHPELAVDGDATTRWASAGIGKGGEWLQIDLGAPTAIEGLIIRWETAYAAAYEVQISGDGKRWQTLHRESRGNGGTDVLPGVAGRGRFLRVLCLRGGLHKLFSIWEISFTDEATARALAEGARKARADAGRRARQAVVDRAAHVRERLIALGVRQIVYAVRSNVPDGHWYANFGYYGPNRDRKAYGKGGKLCRLDLATGEVTDLLDDPAGAVRDPVVHYDAKKILFSWRKGGAEHYNLYEINVDGAGLRQITSAEYDDIEPTYLPDGGIVFASGRCKRWVNCWLTQVAILYRCDGDGGDLRAISANLEHENTPWVLPDGRVLFQRWEYVDRSQVHYHHLWTTNPDGTGQMVYYGNLRPGQVFIDAKPIPGTDDVVLINSPGHGAREHAGSVAVLTPKSGPDARGAMRNLTGRGYRDPFPLSAEAFLAARGRDIVLIDGRGQAATVHSIRSELHEPRPVLRRPRERVIPPRIDRDSPTGRLILADVYTGRNMGGVKRGEITKLLVLETLPKPINYTGGMDPLSYGGTFTLERVLGTVPVAPDGSAHMEVPAHRALFFVALDANDDSVKRMQSFLTVMPGEVTSCVGCHEQRTASPANAAAFGRLQAMRHPPSRIESIADVPDVLEFPRDVQPILDRHCLKCHDYDKRSGGVILSGDRGPMFSHSYYTLTWLRQFVDGRNAAVSNRPPRSIGASASPLMKKISGAHHKVAVSSREVSTIRYWIETGAAYPGTYAALGSGMIGGYQENRQVGTDRGWPAQKAHAAALARRCASCHKGARRLPSSLSDEIGVSFWQPRMNDPRLRFSRHRVFNLTRPDKSLILLAPLARAAGGYAGPKAGEGPKSAGRCPVVFKDTRDPGYRALLSLCVAGTERLDTIKRFDMPGFRPPLPYCREMKRYGVLPPSFDPATDPIDVHAIDRVYWRSLWYKRP